MKGGGLRFNQHTREWDPGNVSGAEAVNQYSVDEADALNLLRIGYHPNMAQFWRNEFSNFVDRNIGSREATDIIEAIKKLFDAYKGRYQYDKSKVLNTEKQIQEHSNHVHYTENLAKGIEYLIRKSNLSYGTKKRPIEDEFYALYTTQQAEIRAEQVAKTNAKEREAAAVATKAASEQAEEKKRREQYAKLEIAITNLKKLPDFFDVFKKSNNTVVPKKILRYKDLLPLKGLNEEDTDILEKNNPKIDMNGGSRTKRRKRLRRSVKRRK